MVHNRFGIHWANVPIGEQLGKWALGMGGDCYLVMDGGHDWIPHIRSARPNAIIVHRHAVSNWMEMAPTHWAAEMANLFHDYKNYTHHVELECEPDIFPNFPGWGQPIIDRLKFAAEWNIQVTEALRKDCPGVIIHSPPLAHERIDLPHWFEIWKPVLDVCDILDMHCYWEKGGKYYKPGLYNPEESYHRAFRYRKIHNFLESQNYHIPMMVTECGNFAPDRLDYTNELEYYFSELEKDADYMIGGCVFILKSNVHNWVNDLTRQPNIERFFRRLRETPKKNLPYPNGGNNMENPIKVGIRENYKVWNSPIVEIKTMEMEEYLRYCVPYEVYPSWKLEALKAQAVAARTYAEYRKAHPKHDRWPGPKKFDICTSACCQVMGPHTFVSTDIVVEATKGEVIRYRGKPIFAEYSANCGGYTNWGSVPYLKPRPCKCFEISPHKEVLHGHGRGLCQWGAEEMARRGKTYREILCHYYTLENAPDWEAKYKELKNRVNSVHEDLGSIITTLEEDRDLLE